MVLSKAVIATDIPGTRQAIHESLWTDCLSQPNNENDLADKLLAMLLKSEKAMRIGDLNRQSIIDNFSIDGMCNYFMSLTREASPN